MVVSFVTKDDINDIYPKLLSSHEFYYRNPYSSAKVDILALVDNTSTITTIVHGEIRKETNTIVISEVVGADTVQSLNMLTKLREEFSYVQYTNLVRPSFKAPYIILGLTNKCNMNCHYCYIDKADRTRQEEYDIEAMRFIKDLVFKALVENTIFDGCKLLSAEPTVVSAKVLSDIINILHLVANHTELITNGQNMADTEYRKTLIGGIWDIDAFSLGVSIDGPAVVNDKLRGAGTYNKAITTVFSMLEEYPSIPVNIGAVISEHSVHHTSEMLEWADMLKNIGVKMLPNVIETIEPQPIERTMRIALLIRELNDRSFINGMYEHLYDQFNECEALFINNDGSVYNCTVFSGSTALSNIYSNTYVGIAKIRAENLCHTRACLSFECQTCELLNDCIQASCHKFRVDGKSVYCLKGSNGLLEV